MQRRARRDGCSGFCCSLCLSCHGLSVPVSLGSQWPPVSVLGHGGNPGHRLTGSRCSSAVLYWDCCCQLPLHGAWVLSSHKAPGCFLQVQAVP